MATESDQRSPARVASWAALLVAGVVGFEVAIYNLAQTGTCASGGPYVIGNECPSGTTGWLLLLFGSIAAMFVGGVGVGVIGERNPRKGRKPWLPVLAFVPTTRECAIFATLTAGVILLAAYAPWEDTASGVKEGAAIAAACLLVLGPGARLVAVLLLRAAEGPRTP